MNNNDRITQLEETQALHIEAIKALEAKINALEATPVRNRGPKSDRTMTDDDALRCISGDLKDASHKQAAETLNLSYGQIYSARKGFTFKPIHKAIQAG